MNRKRLWAPWRLGYITRTRRPSTGCLFCQKARSRADARNLVITRGKYGFTLLNLYPYINGHLLVAPFRHVGRIQSLTEAEWRELFTLIRGGMDRLDRTMRPMGYNIGFNLGRAAGAGVLGHLHLHIVPRWRGDNNFMPVLSDTRVLSQSLRSAYRLLRGC